MKNVGLYFTYLMVLIGEGCGYKGSKDYSINRLQEMKNLIQSYLK